MDGVPFTEFLVHSVGLEDEGIFENLANTTQAMAVFFRFACTLASAGVFHQFATIAKGHFDLLFNS